MLLMDLLPIVESNKSSQEEVCVMFRSFICILSEGYQTQRAMIYKTGTGVWSFWGNFGLWDAL